MEDVCYELDLNSLFADPDGNIVYLLQDANNLDNNLVVESVQCLPEDFNVSDDVVPNLENLSIDDAADKFPCLQCNLRFSSERKLKTHGLKHNVEQCPHCSVTVRRDNLQRHIQTHSDPPIKCELCGAVAKNRESLRGHINYHHRNKPSIKCEDCAKEFKSCNHYKAHKQKVHMKIRNSQCEICGNRFFANHDLQKHIQTTHNKERPYPCEQCSKHFSSRYALKTHTRLHSGEKPFMCHLCAKTFTQKVSLNKHLVSQHSQNENP